MKIMLDTNVLISALIFGGQAGKLLEKLFESEDSCRKVVRLMKCGQPFFTL